MPISNNFCVSLNMTLEGKGHTKVTRSVTLNSNSNDNIVQKDTIFMTVIFALKE